MNEDLEKELYDSTELTCSVLKDPAFAHLSIESNRIIGANLLPGIEADTEELTDGVSLKIKVREGTKIVKPIHMCFGMLHRVGMQRIILDIDVEEDCAISLMAHCTFPNAIDITHMMDAKINIGENSSYSYFERHIHGESGGVKVIPSAFINVKDYGKLKTEFELLKGRVGLIDINYETSCANYAILEMNARISGKADDRIKIHETGYLNGEHSRGVLTSRIAVRNSAEAEVFNKLTAIAPYARGHVDCKEIIQDNGIAKAVPIVEVRNNKAHITHEAAIGSVDSRQLETLMSRGLSEDDAVEMIIQGLLS